MLSEMTSTKEVEVEEMTGRIAAVKRQLSTEKRTMQRQKLLKELWRLTHDRPSSVVSKVG